MNRPRPGVCHRCGWRGLLIKRLCDECTGVTFAQTDVAAGGPPLYLRQSDDTPTVPASHPLLRRGRLGQFSRGPVPLVRHLPVTDNGGPSSCADDRPGHATIVDNEVLLRELRA